MRRTKPPSPTFPLTPLTLCLTLALALALRGFRAFPGFPGRSDFSRFFSTLWMQEGRHLLQVFAGLKLGFDLGDVSKFLSGLQEGLLDFVEMLDLMFDQAGDESAMIVGALWRFADLCNQLIFFFYIFPHTSNTQQLSSGRKVSVSGTRKLLEFFSRDVRWS